MPFVYPELWSKTFTCGTRALFSVSTEGSHAFSVLPPDVDKYIDGIVAETLPDKRKPREANAPRSCLDLELFLALKSLQEMQNCQPLAADRA
jgi:hypothetical protein